MVQVEQLYSGGNSDWLYSAFTLIRMSALLINRVGSKPDIRLSPPPLVDNRWFYMWDACEINGSVRLGYYSLC